MNKNANLINRVLLSLQSALLGEVYPKIRAIGFETENLDSITIYAYFDSEPTEDDVENISLISTLVVADIEFKTVKEECVFSLKPFKDLRSPTAWAYMRKEG